MFVIIFNITLLPPSILSPEHPAPDLRTERHVFYHEIAILKKISTGENPHVIAMVGYIAQENPPAIVLEYAPFGNLHDFLVKFRDEVRAMQLPNGVFAPRCLGNR